MPRPKISLASILLALTATVLSPHPTTASSDFAVARRSDEAIVDFVSRLQPLRAEIPTAWREGAVVVYRSVLHDCRRFESLRSENRSYTLFDESDPGVARPVLDFPWSEVRLAEAWRVRADGHVDRFEGTIESVDAGRSSRVRFDFGRLRPGETFGWSVVLRETEGLALRREPLDFDHYVVRSRVHVRGEALLTHRVVPRNVDDGEVEVEVVERRRGFPTQLRADFTHQEPSAKEIFPLPALRGTPRLDILRQGRFYHTLDTWMLANDWELWVAMELGQPASWIAVDDDLRALAHELTAGITNEREMADALYRFVRDEITTEDPGPSEDLLGPSHVAINLDLPRLQRSLDEEDDSPLSERYRLSNQLPVARSEVSGADALGPRHGPAEVLARGRGSRLEKTVLLASLFEAVYLPTRLGFSRDRDFGPHDHESTGRWQFTDAFVVLLTPDLRPDLWYCPTREGLPPGVLPVGLQGVPMLTVRLDLDEKVAGLWEQAGREAGPRVVMRVPRWVKLLDFGDWVVWTQTPGFPSELCAFLEESLELDVATGEAEAEVRTRGEIDPGGHDYWARRYPTAEIVSFEPRRPPSRTDVTARDLRARLALGDPGRPEGELWPLRADVLFGVGPLDGWSGPDREPFHVSRTTDRRWLIRVPLPERWTRIVVPPAFAQQHERLVYRAQFRQEDDALVIDRRLRMLAGTSEGEELASLDDVISSILLFERGRLVIRAAASGR